MSRSGSDSWSTTSVTSSSSSWSSSSVPNQGSNQHRRNYNQNLEYLDFKENIPPQYYSLIFTNYPPGYSTRDRNGTTTGGRNQRNY